MEIQLSDHFTYKRLIRFVLPCISMMVFTSIYGVIDGFFVSNYGGKNSFAAVNLIMPFIMGTSAVGFMIGAGGSALVSYHLGRNEKKLGQQIFSMLIYTLLLTSVSISLLGFVFMPQIVSFLGASEIIRTDSILYGRISMISLPFFTLGNAFQSFFTVAERPKFGLRISLLAGCLNIILDFVFVYYLKLGVIGAATATVISEYTGGGIPFLYFLRPNSTTLRLRKTKIRFYPVKKACINGISELMSSLSSSTVAVLYNFQLMKYAAENGIAAYGVIMYVSFIFTSIYYGYTLGINPLIGYHYGAKNHDELHNLLKKSLVLTVLAGIFIVSIAQLFTGTIANIYVGYDSSLFKLTKTAFRIYSLAFLINGLNIFTSAFFTGLNNGKVSAIISISRTFVIQIICIFFLPFVFGINGIWSAIIVSELLTLCISIFFLKTKQKMYRY